MRVLLLITMSVISLGLLSEVADAKCTPNDPFEQDGCLPRSLPKDSSDGETSLVIKTDVLQCFLGDEANPFITIYENNPQPGSVLFETPGGGKWNGTFWVQAVQRPNNKGLYDIEVQKDYFHPFYRIEVAGYASSHSSKKWPNSYSGQRINHTIETVQCRSVEQDNFSSGAGAELAAGACCSWGQIPHCFKGC